MAKKDVKSKPTESEAVESDKKKERKEKKKAEKAAANAALAATPSAEKAEEKQDDSDAAAAAKAERKRAKKEKKEKKAAAAAAAAATSEGASSSSNSNGTVETEEEKAKRKREKKERKAAKRKAAEAVESSTATTSNGHSNGAAAAEEEEAQQPKKKQKLNNGTGTVATNGNGKASKHAKGGVTHNYYKPHASVAGMTQDDIQKFRTEHGIVLSDKHHEEKDYVAHYPCLEFAYLKASVTKEVLGATGKFSRPTPIQAQCWPLLLSGRDVIGVAKTGSGKTLAFMLPALVHIQDRITQGNAGTDPICLVLAPTRELAMQTATVCAEAAETASHIQSACIYGGQEKHKLLDELKKSPHVIIATPGRLLGFIRERRITLSNVTYAVLDEADRMLDHGFEPDIRELLGMTSQPRQTAMFTATWPEAVQALGNEFLHRPVQISIGVTDKLAANKDVQQIVEVLEPHAREQRLLELLNKYHASRKNRVLIFVLYKKEADQIEQMLHRRGWKHAVAINGDRAQADRTAAIEGFRSGKSPLLIATDVAARGLDIPDVEYVINFSFPLTIDEYVHRIGRTGRAGKKGLAHTLFTKLNKGLAGALTNVLRDTGNSIPADLTKFGTFVKKKAHPVYGDAYNKNIDDVTASKKATRVTFD